MRIYNVTITGTQPLILHHDDIEWADRMNDWRLDKNNKAASKAGDDRTPAFRWIGCLYRDESGQIILPTENIMRALMEGGAQLMTGKGQKTFKAQSQSGIMPRAIGWPLLVGNKPVETKTIDRLLNEKSFTAHMDAVQKMGFRLLVKRARVGQSKHIRVRPIFDTWSTTGQLAVIDDAITDDVLQDIFDVAGTYKGLGDWRPSSKTPGTYGMFKAEIARA